MATRIHIVAGYIHRELCEAMATTAESVCEQHGAVISDVTWVPGSLEAPLAVKLIMESSPPDAIIVFGVQARGETKHGEVIAHQATSKLLDLQIEYQIPMAISIIGPNATLRHAASKTEYVSEKAVLAVVDMVALKHELKTQEF